MSISDHQMIQHQMFRIKHTELNEIFLVMSLRSFVCSMIAIFVPIYLYTLGYSLADILWFNAQMYSFELIFEYLSARVRTELGPKHAIALSMPPLIAHFWMLATIQTYHWPLWFIGLCAGFSMAMYWQAYHYDFSKSKHKNAATKDVSKIYIIIAVLGAIAPLIGGSVAYYLGFGYLYLFVIAGLLVVFIPLLKQGEKHVARTLDLGKVKLRKIWIDLISYGGAGLEGTISTMIWPLFVFLIVKSYQSVGIVTSAALVVTIAVTYYVGKKVNDANRHGYIKFSSFLDGFIYVLLTFVDSFVQVASLNLARSLVSSLRSAPYTSEYYLHADEYSRSEYIFFMESVIDLFKIIMYSLLAVLTLYLDFRLVLVVGLLFGAAGAVLAGLMPRAKCEIPYCKGATIRVTPKLRSIRETNR